MRKILIVPNEYYHVFNRGNNKQLIFEDNRDYLRFLFLLLHFQSDIPIYNIGSFITYYIKHRVFNISKTIADKIIKNRSVELINFTLEPNHFHITIKGIGEKGISNYMQRILNAYTKYFNTKYTKSGHLFQGPYKAVHIKDNKQLLYLSTYIHRNCREIIKWKNKEDLYPWSSYQDYTKENRWNKLLEQDVILNQFSSKESYDDFVKSSTAKELGKNLDNELLLD